jgi:glycosyltransferase involved in cell wall biosynthesis
LDHERLRILQVYRTYFPDTQGGLEEVIRQTCRSARSLGAEVKVYTLSRKPSPPVVEHEGIEVHRVRQSFEVASCGVSLSGLTEFRRLATWADVVHYHFPWPFADVLHFAGSRPRPALVTYHSDVVRQRYLGRIYQPLMFRFLRDVDAVVCTSPNYLATSDVLRRCDNVEVIPIGISESSYPRADEDDVARAQARYGSDFFLFVGVLRYYKGLHVLLEAMRNAPFKVVIVGSGPTEGELKAQARRLGLDNVVFAGQVDDREKMALFRLARAVVFPSHLRSEAFGVTLLEGAMSGRALISTEVGTGTSHVNVDGETGLVVAPGSPAALREALDRLWAQPELAAALGARARARYEQRFTGELMGQRYVDLYRRLLDGPPPATTDRD